MHINDLSTNGHETHGQMAHRNLDIFVGRLKEMRWMMVNACSNDPGALAAYDEGLAKLAKSLNIISATIRGAKPASEDDVRQALAQLVAAIENEEDESSSDLAVAHAKEVLAGRCPWRE